MRKRTIVIITMILLLLVILILLLFNSYLNNEENENLVQNVITNTNNSNIETNVSSNQEDANTNNEITNSIENTNEEINNSEGGEEMKLNIKIGDKNFTATLEDNETTRSLLEKLPLTITMSELHGNEKYYYFNDSMPTNSERMRNINTGDIMLYGSDCLVLFYESFSTSYSYTRLGHIDNPEGLEDAVGSGNVTVTFEVAD